MSLAPNGELSRPKHHSFPGGSTDWELQSRDAAALPSEVALDARFLEPGRFLALPPGVDPPTRIHVAPTAENRSIPIQRGESPIVDVLGRSMDDQWSILHDRASLSAMNSPPNANTLTRYAYNTFGIRHILSHLDQRDVQEAQVLLVSGYESPIELLIENERVAGVTIVDLSPRSLEVVSDRYSGHDFAGKITLRTLDVSGLGPEFQAAEIEALAEATREGRLSTDSVRSHFSKIANGQHLAQIDLASDSFHAAHLPFVLGSLYLGPVTVACRASLSGENVGLIDYQDALGEALKTKEAQAACITVAKYALQETRRIVGSSGCIIANIWARPQRDAPGLIRMSDTLIPPEAFDELLSGSVRLFSGNPQPTLQKAVGHVFRW